jgi:hypothetical protein
MGPDQLPRNRSGDRQRASARSCRRSGAGGQLPAASGLQDTWSQLWALPPVIALVGFVALASCQSVDRPGAAVPEAASEPAPAEAEPSATAAAPSAYPSLHTVPPRPRLSYTVEQRRAIVEGLIADRVNARYTDQVVRYRSGQSSLPPPPAPRTALAALVPESLIEPPATEAAPDEPAKPAPEYLDDDDQVSGQPYDDDTLSGFVDELAHDTAEEPLDVPAAPGSADTTGSEPEDADGDGPGWLDWLGGLLGQTEAEAVAPAGAVAAAPAATAPAIRTVDDDTFVASIRAAWRKEGAAGEEVDQAEAASAPAEPLPAAAPPARPAPGDAGIAISANGVVIGQDVASVAADARPTDETASSILVRFEPGSATLPHGVGARLEQVLANAKAQGAVIRIEGEALAPALALDRAHAVALGLMRLGARARDLELALAPAVAGDQARVVLTAPAAR